MARAIVSHYQEKTYEKLLQTFAGYFGANDIHRQLDVRWPTLREALSERVVKDVRVYRIRLGLYFVEQSLRAREGPGHVGEGSEARSGIERVVQQCSFFLHISVDHGAVYLHVGTRRPDDMEHGKPLSE